MPLAIRPIKDVNSLPLDCHQEKNIFSHQHVTYDHSPDAMINTM